MISNRKESLQYPDSWGSGWKGPAPVLDLELRALLTWPCHQNPSPSWLQSGTSLEVTRQGRPWQGKGREQRKQEGRRSCIPSLLLIILLFRLSQAGRSASTTLSSYFGRGSGMGPTALGTEGGRGAGLDNNIQITPLLLREQPHHACKRQQKLFYPMRYKKNSISDYRKTEKTIENSHPDSKSTFREAPPAPPGVSGYYYQGKISFDSSWGSSEIRPLTTEAR